MDAKTLSKTRLKQQQKTWLAPGVMEMTLDSDQARREEKKRD